jgi:hypothetical protein
VVTIDRECKPIGTSLLQILQLAREQPDIAMQADLQLKQWLRGA